MPYTFTQAMDFYERGDYVHAASAFRNSLELGDERCAYGLALCLLTGHGLTFSDKSSAQQLIDGYLPRIADYARGGDGEACRVMGMYYSSGCFAVPDRGEARRWFALGARAGDDICARLLGSLPPA